MEVVEEAEVLIDTHIFNEVDGTKASSFLKKVITYKSSTDLLLLKTWRTMNCTPRTMKIIREIQENLLFIGKRKEFTGRLKINHPAFRFSKSTSIVVSITLNSFKEHHGDVTTGVRRWFQRGVEGEPAGNNMTRPATQVGPRAVEAGLGGHDAGV